MYVALSSLSVQAVEGVAGIGKRNAFSVAVLEDEAHSMDSCFTASFLSSA